MSEPPIYLDELEKLEAQLIESGMPPSKAYARASALIFEAMQEREKEGTQ